MARKKYIRRRIVKLDTLKEELPNDFFSAFEECITADEKRYKYVRFGYTTDLKAQYDKHCRRDDICWSSMKVYFQTPWAQYPHVIERRYKNERENYIDNNIIPI